MTPPRRADPVRQLLRALDRSAADANLSATFDHRALTAWSSATFEGARHVLHVTAADEAALARWFAMLPEADLPLHGRFVASCAGEIIGDCATIELLVLDA